MEQSLRSQLVNRTIPSEIQHDRSATEQLRWRIRKEENDEDTHLKQMNKLEPPQKESRFDELKR